MSLLPNELIARIHAPLHELDLSPENKTNSNKSTQKSETATEPSQISSKDPDPKSLGFLYREGTSHRSSTLRKELEARNHGLERRLYAFPIGINVYTEDQSVPGPVKPRTVMRRNSPQQNRHKQNEYLDNDLALKKKAVGENGTHMINSHDNCTDYDAEGHREN